VTTSAAAISRSDAVALRDALSPADLAEARTLFLDYARELGVSLCFQGFDEELATLPGRYAPPRGALLLAGPAGASFGCVALRPVDRDGVGEVKRLYVRGDARGHAYGRLLATRIVDRARRIGYRELVLDTLAQMTAARALYASLGFVPCAPYYDNPLPGVLYMRLAL